MLYKDYLILFYLLQIYAVSLIKRLTQNWKSQVIGTKFSCQFSQGLLNSRQIKCVYSDVNLLRL